MRKVKKLVEFKLPDSKFKENDIVKIMNKNNIIIMISKVIYFGNIIHCEECKQTFTNFQGYRYEGIVQLNSFDEKNNPIRPGKAILYNSDIEQFDIIYDYKFPTIEGDNPLNIKQREKDWRIKIRELKGN